MTPQRDTPHPHRMIRDMSPRRDMAAQLRDMPELLRDMPLFVEVAKTKSFSLAAENLDMYASTLSRRIALLEDRLGVPLFTRNTRRVELTDSGKMFFDKCRYLLSEATNMYDEVVHNMSKPVGPVRIAVPADLYHVYMWGMMGEFAKKWPDIYLSIHFMHRWVDLLAEPFDVDIRIGPLPDSDLRARKLISLTPGMFATREFFTRYPMPETPQDLKNTPCIVMPQQGTAWYMRKGKKTIAVTVKPAHTVNSISMALEMALAGMGIAWLSPAILEHPTLNTVSLVPVLPEWTIPDIDINAVVAGNQLPYRVRLFLDYLVAHFSRMTQ